VQSKLEMYRLLTSCRQLEKSEKAHTMSTIVPKYLLGAELFYADRHDEANSSFSAIILRKHLK